LSVSSRFLLLPPPSGSPRPWLSAEQSDSWHSQSCAHAWKQL